MANCSHVYVQGTPQNANRKCCICTEFISKTRDQNEFCYIQGPFNNVSFAVSRNLVCITILFQIVKLIFPYILRLCNAICVEYRVTCIHSSCVLHIAYSVKTQ